MKLLLFNALAVAAIFAPVGLLEYLSYKSEWGSAHEEGLTWLAWGLGLAFGYFVVLPRLGLGPNPALHQW